MAVKSTFRYGTDKVPMELGYAFATGKLEDLGIDVLSILSDGGATMQKILLDDRAMLKVWYHYVKEYNGDDWETAIEVLDNTQGGLEDFRESFYQLVVNFSPPQARKLLAQMWEKVKNDMRDSKRLKSLLSSSSSSEEPELTPENILSEN